jgi:hypothetical protein
MLRPVNCALVAASLLFAACGTNIRQQEGAACSTNSSDDPQLVCSPALDLVCISTYSRVVTNPQVRAQYDGGIRPIYVCRIACNTTEECRNGDVCCPGPIYGKTYDKSKGCTPLEFCPSAAPPDGGDMPSDDAGTTDGGAHDAPADTRADAGAPDAAIDVANDATNG